MVYFNILHSGGGGRRGRTAAPLAVLAAPSRAARARAHACRRVAYCRLREISLMRRMAEPH